MNKARIAAVLVVVVVGAFGLPAAVSAQSDVSELVTDRPDFTESSAVVGRGMLQVEMGSTVESEGSGDGRARTVTAPLALVRLGLSPSTELRLSGDGGIFSSYGQGPGRVSASGGSDIELGMKWVFLDRADAGLAMAVIPMVSLPVGSQTMSSGTYDPTVKFTWAKSLSRGFDLSGNVNMSRPTDADGRYTEQAYSASLAHALSTNWGGYWEVYGFVPTGRDDGQAWTANTGVTRGIGGNAQIDLEVGRGLTAGAPDWFVGVGMGIRTSALRRSR